MTDTTIANGALGESGAAVYGVAPRCGSAVCLDRSARMSCSTTSTSTSAPGEVVALLGASGCGKTTLLRILGGLDDEATGRVDGPRRPGRGLPGALASSRGAGCGRTSASACPRSERRPAATAALDEVGLSGREEAWPNILSGGEAARVALARALVRQPKLLLLDEPFAALDALTRIKMHALVRQLWERHHPAVVMVTHDVDEAIVLADRVVVMNDGRIAHHETISGTTPPASRRSRSRSPPESTHGAARRGRRHLTPRV